MTIFKYVLLPLSLCFASPAWSTEVIARVIPDAEIVGEGRLTFAFWDVYDATLYAPEGEWRAQKNFALSIRYLRDIEGSAIAERSVEEMRAQGFSDESKLAAWNIKMKTIFPNVREGTVLSAVFIRGKKTVFYEGDKKIGVIKDPRFTQLFANIWLGENTSEPSLRRQLLGL